MIFIIKRKRFSVTFSVVLIWKVKYKKYKMFELYDMIKLFYD